MSVSWPANTIINYEFLGELKIMTHAKIANALEGIKWPFAMICIVLLPPATLQLFHQITPLLHSLTFKSYFMYGFFGFFVILSVFSHFMFNLFMPFEHEISHGIFVTLTFNKVTALKVFEEGGKIEYQGTSNWLILLAPYFFPTVALFVAIGTGFLDPKWKSWGQFWLGVSIAYQLFSTLVETELRQPDLIQSGIPFSVMTLPFLNVLSYSLLTAYLTGGLRAIGLTFKEILISPVNPCYLVAKWVFFHAH